MSKLANITSRGRFLGAAVALAAMAATSAISPMLVSADQVLNRSLALTSSAPGTSGIGDAGSATNGEKAGYTFTFNAAKDSTFQSWSAVFCTKAFSYADGNGVNKALSAPCGGEDAGVDASHLTDAPTVTVGGSATTGTWSVATGSESNVIRITSTAAETVTANDQIVITFAPNSTSYITNPNTEIYPANTFFGHTSMYSDDDYTTVTDDGTVVSATTMGVGITSRVQETLKFSVGTEVTDPSTTCAALGNGVNSDNSLTMGDSNGALSVADAYDTNSFFRVSTNAVKGTNVQYAGKTLVSGNKFIAPIGATAVETTPGTEQFGLGIDSSYTGTNFTDSTVLAATAQYTNSDGSLASGTPTFAFDAVADANTANPVTIAAASTGNVIECGTKAVRYVGNINNNTPAGIYKTTINYIAVPKY